jgi:hypothetical protein
MGVLSGPGITEGGFLQSCRATPHMPRWFVKALGQSRGFALMDSGTLFGQIRHHPERFFIVHYSSEGIYDDGLDRDGLSPRITSIAVMHFSTRQTVTFATHAIAEEMHISKTNIEARYDGIEREILERFYAFVRDRREKIWIHWQMKNITFGFEHLEHRYRILTGKEPPHIPVEVRFNLSDMLRERYGDSFAPNPRMLSLMLQNGARDQRFLDGKEETEAFRAKDFIRMHSSTISKDEFFHHAIQLAMQGKLKPAGRSLPILIDRVLEGRLARLAAL